MSKKTKQFLSVLLAAAMILSHAHISYAADSDKAEGAPAPASQTEADGSKELELQDLDPASLNVKKLGETEPNEGETTELTPVADLEKSVRVTIRSQMASDPPRERHLYDSQAERDPSHRETGRGQSRCPGSILRSSGHTGRRSAADGCYLEWNDRRGDGLEQRIYRRRHEDRHHRYRS